MGLGTFSGVGGAFNAGGSHVAPKAKGAYWVGKDGNVYVAGSNGTNSAGRADSNTNAYWGGKGFTRINDPNPQPNRASVGGDGGATSNQNLTIRRNGEIAPAVPAGPSEQYTSGLNNINDSVGRAISSGSKNLQGGIEDFTLGYKQQQRAINSGGVNSALKKLQSSQGILGQVGRNIKSGNVMLANKNAGDSSAAGALAQAYGEQGRRQMSGVGNTYAQEQDALAQQQADLADQAALYEKKLAREKELVVNNILDATQQQLQALNDSLANASIADRVDISKEIARVKSEAVAALSKYDSSVRNTRSKYKSIDVAEQQRQAAEKATKGLTYGGDAFDWSSIDQGGQLQDSGALPADLPLYTFAGQNKDQQQGV